MTKGRLEAFSDGVIAIIITILVLEFKIPHGADWAALKPLVPILFSHVLSFVFIGIYWSNHHHLLQTVKHANGAILWANLHLLFWLSLIPFTTAWMGENHFSNLPVALYGVVLLFTGVAYFMLTQVLIARHGKGSLLAIAVGDELKGKISVILYTIAIVFSFIYSIVSYVIYIGVAILWLVPDRRIEKTLETHSS